MTIMNTNLDTLTASFQQMKKLETHIIKRARLYAQLKGRPLPEDGKNYARVFNIQVVRDTLYSENPFITIHMDWYNTYHDGPNQKAGISVPREFLFNQDGTLSTIRTIN